MCPWRQYWMHAQTNRHGWGKLCTFIPPPWNKTQRKGLDQRVLFLLRSVAVLNSARVDRAYYYRARRRDHRVKTGTNDNLNNYPNVFEISSVRGSIGSRTLAGGRLLYRCFIEKGNCAAYCVSVLLNESWQCEKCFTVKKEANIKSVFKRKFGGERAKV